MTQERRRANRMDINACIKLSSVRNKGNLDGLKNDAFEVYVL